jgi:uncharacterized transporter YbjL
MGPLTLLLVLIVAIILALTTLRRTRDLPHPLSANDSRGRVLALVVLVVFVAGFGLCGGAGFVFGIAGFVGSSHEEQAYAMIALVPGLIGLAIAGAGGWALWKFRRNKAADQASGNQAEP